jgi:H+-transporting ATPase
MTGDGVNDAPALKKADCGIAVSGATDAARAAASIVLMTPGLSVIIDAIKESRRIVQRMNSYAIYRIAETLRVLGFVTLVILLFNFFPGHRDHDRDARAAQRRRDPVDRLRQRPLQDQPEAWNMRLVLGIASVLGVVGPIAAFGLFYLGDKVFTSADPRAANDDVPDAVRRRPPHHLPDPHPRPVLVDPPRRILLIAVTARRPIATVIAVGGIFVTPLPWEYGRSLVWGYAIAWFLITDRVKLFAYRILDPVPGRREPLVRAGESRAGAPRRRSADVARSRPRAPRRDRGVGGRAVVGPLLRESCRSSLGLWSRLPPPGRTPP